MSKLSTLVHLAITGLVAYQEAKRPRNRAQVMGQVALVAVAAVMATVALGFGLAAVFWALEPLGAVAACLITGGLALVACLLALLMAQQLNRRR